VLLLEKSKSLSNFKIKMKFFKSHFAYSKSQRNGIFILFTIIVVVQLVIFCFKFPSNTSQKQLEIVTDVQKQLDSIQGLKKEYYIKPFNPNYLSDYKGYQLGMSLAQIDRLFAYRKKGNYINSAKDFKTVTQVSDSLLSIISPLFKFPDWKKKYLNKKKVISKKITKPKKDINKATIKELMELKGIGVKRANTIVKYRKLLKGFSYESQLDEVWGLTPENILELKNNFKVLSKPSILKINVNMATVKELNRIVYINYKQAKSIVSYRKEVAEIQNLAELKTISNFPVDKFDLISLYLQAH